VSARDKLAELRRIAQDAGSLNNNSWFPTMRAETDPTTAGGKVDLHIAAWSPDRALRFVAAVEAALAFVEQVELCKAMVSMAHCHGWRHNGPEWVKQREQLRTALAAALEE